MFVELVLSGFDGEDDIFDSVVMSDAEVGEFPRATGTGLQPSVFDDIDVVRVLPSNPVVEHFQSDGFKKRRASQGKEVCW